jgi:hypothetical protein
MGGLIGLMAAPFTFPVAYVTGALPAAITGFGFSLMWISGLGMRPLYFATGAIGGVTSALAAVLHGADVLSAMLTGAAGVVAAVVSANLAAHLILRVETDRAPPPAPSSPG